MEKDEIKDFLQKASSKDLEDFCKEIQIQQDLYEKFKTLVVGKDEIIEVLSSISRIKQIFGGDYKKLWK
jgi:hypothetical protein